MFRTSYDKYKKEMIEMNPDDLDINYDEIERKIIKTAKFAQVYGMSNATLKPHNKELWAKLQQEIIRISKIKAPSEPRRQEAIEATRRKKERRALES